MKILRNLIVLFTLLISPLAWADVGFKIVTKDGYVAFSAGKEWPVVSMQSQMPVTVSAFQIPNLADKGAPHSTNLVFMFYEHGSQKAAKLLKSIGKQFGTEKPSREHYGKWEVFRQLAVQGEATYVVLDAKRELTKVSASVRLAWPRLNGNADNYDAEMEKLFQSALNSVTEQVGEYHPESGDTVQRPSQ